MGPANNEAVAGLCNSGRSTPEVPKISHEEVIAASTAVAPTSTSSATIAWENSTQHAIPNSTTTNDNDNDNDNDNNNQVTEHELSSADLEGTKGQTEQIVIACAFFVIAVLACCCLARRT